MSAYLSPAGNEQQSDANGAPVSGALINTYAAGTTTPITTYTDAAGLSPQANPIVCNASGYPASPIYLPSGQAVKMVFTTSVASGSVAYRPAVDNIQGVNDPSYTTTQTEWTPYSATASFISATSFSVAGDQRGTFQNGRRIKSTNTGGTVYSTVAASSFAANVTTVTVVNASGTLDSGLSAVSYGLLGADNASVPAASPFVAQLQEFRLTLTTGVPVTTSDVTAASTVYACPYTGNRIALYNGTQWQVFNSAQFSIALSALTGSLPYDLFAYNNNGVPTLEKLAWTSASSRATALAYQDGILVKTGDATRRYMGTFYALTATTTEDSQRRRLLWNNYHRIRRSTRWSEATATWAYTTATWRQTNGVATNQCEFMCGLAEDAVELRGGSAFSNTTAGVAAQIGIGVDGTTGPVAGSLTGQAAASGINQITAVNAHYSDIPASGYHFYPLLEFSAATGATTWSSSGVLTGMVGSVMA